MDACIEDIDLVDNIGNDSGNSVIDISDLERMLNMDSFSSKDRYNLHVVGKTPEGYAEPIVSKTKEGKYMFYHSPVIHTVASKEIGKGECYHILVSKEGISLFNYSSDSNILDIEKDKEHYKKISCSYNGENQEMLVNYSSNRRDVFKTFSSLNNLFEYVIEKSKTKGQDSYWRLYDDLDEFSDSHNADFKVIDENTKEKYFQDLNFLVSPFILKKDKLNFKKDLKESLKKSLFGTNQEISNFYNKFKSGDSNELKLHNLAANLGMLAGAATVSVGLQSLIPAAAVVLDSVYRMTSANSLIDYSSSEGIIGYTRRNLKSLFSKR